MKMCIVEGCDRKPVGRELCRTHYERQRRNGTVELLPRISNKNKICEYGGCGRPVKSKGLCGAHAKQRRKGQELRPLKNTPNGLTSLDVIMSFVSESLENRSREECWTDWPFALSHKYPKAGPKRLSHLVLEMIGFERPPAPRNNALHSCDTPQCWNPDHLRWGTLKENAQDVLDRGRALHQKHAKLISWIESQGIEVPEEFI